MAAIFFGREAERDRVEELLDEVGSGPVATVLEGSPGIGKTTVWRESVESARRRGWPVLQTAPSEPEAALAFSGLGDLFESIPGEVVDALPEVQAHAFNAAVFLSEVPEDARDVQALPRAILRVLRELSAEGSVVVAIDDEQWLDPASARVLAFALCRLREERIGVIVARRAGSGGSLSVELDRRFGGRGMESIVLEPLPIGAIKMMLEARLDRMISAPVVRRIHQVAGGNPLWTLAIALEVDARYPDRGSGLPIPRTLSDAIELRLEHVDRRAKAAVGDRRAVTADRRAVTSRYPPLRAK